MNAELLQQGAQSFGIELDHAMLERFKVYMHEMERWNRTINLTAITEPDQIVGKHFVDSLSMVPLLRQGERMLDIGSGAGFPGLVVAMVRPDVFVTTLDASQKKIHFQRHICRLLSLKQVKALHGRVEQLADQRLEGYDLVTSRAFRDPRRFVQLATQLVRPGGRLVAMTAGNDSGDKQVTEDLCACYNLEYSDTLQYCLPSGMGRRALLVMRRKMH